MRNITLFALAALWATSAQADEVRVITTPATPGCCSWTVVAIGGGEEAKPAPKPDTPRPPKKPDAKKPDVKKSCQAQLAECAANLEACTKARTQVETDLAALRATLKGCQDAGKLYDPATNACENKPAPAGGTRAVRGRAPAPAAPVPPAGEDTEPFTTRSRAGSAQ